MTKKTYLLYIRKYDILCGGYNLYVYKVDTDNIYRIIGKIVCTSIEEIKRIDYVIYTEEKEKFWKEKGYTIQEYKEPELSED